MDLSVSVTFSVLDQKPDCKNVVYLKVLVQPVLTLRTLVSCVLVNDCLVSCKCRFITISLFCSVCKW